MRPLPLPLRPRARLAAIAAFVVVLALILLGYQAFGPPETAREQAAVILHGEVAQFPLPPGSQQLGQHERDLPLYPPEIEREYSAEMACLEVHRFYQEAAPAAGWIVDSESQFPQEVRSLAHKSVGDVTLNVAIECDQATPGFSLFFSAP